ncbi:MAG: tetratricopeptide repeat protein [Planctomycetes bacterium]|nr:tetratricopeptide repeat protein [Planctomycetota bacterium]MBI3844761.1 tetratricopeptide repeat protein [Planctomycetota bacterium]
MRRIGTVAFGLLLAALPACDQRVQSLEEHETEQAQAMDLPLPKTGPYSEEALGSMLAKLDGDEHRKTMERAYRLIFTRDQKSRDPRRALEELDKLEAMVPNYAPAFRIGGYACFLLQDLNGAFANYTRATEIDPRYGDAYYALASLFVMTQQDPDKTKQYLDKALALGVPDSMQLKDQVASMAARPRADAEMPAGHPAPGGPAATPAADVPTDGEAIPLKLTGIGSVKELERANAKLHDPALQKSLDKGFRYTFSTKTQFRDHSAAIAEFQKVIAGDPACAAAYRGLAYVLFDSGQAEESVANYKKAIEVDPDYGEAHYGLSFIQAGGDHAEGLEHFKRAMALGVPDERKLGERFYPEAK